MKKPIRGPAGVHGAHPPLRAPVTQQPDGRGGGVSVSVIVRCGRGGCCSYSSGWRRVVGSRKRPRWWTWTWTLAGREEDAMF